MIHLLRGVRRVEKSLDRKAVEDFVMQYRIERAARVGWVSLFLFGQVLTVIAYF